MSAQDLMNGYAVYAEAEELAAEVAQELPPMTISISMTIAATC